MQSDLSAQKCRNVWKKAHFGNVTVTVLNGHLCRVQDLLLSFKKDGMQPRPWLSAVTRLHSFNSASPWQGQEFSLDLDLTGCPRCVEESLPA